MEKYIYLLLGFVIIVGSLIFMNLIHTADKEHQLVKGVIDVNE